MKKTIRKRRKDGIIQRYHINPSRPKNVKNIKKENSITEPKNDGTRTFLFIEKDKPTFINRRQVNKTNIYPELANIGKHIKGDVILDGEIVALDKKHPYGNFDKLSRRDRLKDKAKIRKRSKTIPLTFVAFDILKAGKKDVSNLPLLERKRLMDKLIHQSKEIKEIEFSNKPEEMIKKVKAAKGEGVVIKEIGSKYVPGKTRVWEKLKLLKTNDVAIVGSTPGAGKRKQYFGALKMAVNTPKGMKKVGLVGTGFNDMEIKEIHGKLKKGEKMVARVSYEKLGSKGNYFAPRFVGLREDIIQKHTHA